MRIELSQLSFFNSYSLIIRLDYLYKLELLFINLGQTYI